ncbi:MAG: recombinase family protein [Solirubrobacterales bacterium]
MKLDGYIRVSRVAGRSGDGFISPEEQKKRVKAWATAQGHQIVKWHPELDQPGSKVDRPKLQQAMRRVESGATGGIAVARLDRFGRSVQDTANLLARIRAADGVLCTVAEGIDTSGYMGKFLADLFAALAELELARIRENWDTAKKSAVARGIHVSPKVPTGYLRNEKRVLVPDPEVAPVVRELFRRRAAQTPWVLLARLLEEKGIKTPYGNQYWMVPSVRTIIKNRVYLGEARAGKIINPDAHEPIVTLDEWQAANRAGGVHPARAARGTGGTAGLLSGLLRCAGCSYALKVSANRPRGDKTYLAYSCKSEKAGGRCPAPTSVAAMQIEPFVVEQLFAFARDAKARTQSDEEESTLPAELAAAEAERDAALDSRLADALGGPQSDVYLRTLASRQERVDELLEALAEIEHQREPAEIEADLEEVWEDLTFEDKRRVLRSVFDSVFVWRRDDKKSPIAKRAKLFFAGEGPPVPVRGRRGTIRTLPFD